MYLPKDKTKNNNLKSSANVEKKIKSSSTHLIDNRLDTLQLQRPLSKKMHHSGTPIVQGKFVGKMAEKGMTYEKIHAELEKYYKDVPKVWKIKQLDSLPTPINSLQKAAEVLNLDLISADNLPPTEAVDEVKDHSAHTADIEQKVQNEGASSLKKPSKSFVSGSLVKRKTSLKLVKKSPVEKKEHIDSDVKGKPQNILDKYLKKGLLLRTLASNKIREEVEGNTVKTVEQGLELQDVDSTYNTKSKPLRVRVRRNWTMAHAKLPPNYYKMDEESGTTARRLAILADPEKMPSRYLSFHEKDATSNSRLHNKEKVMDAEDADHGFQKVLKARMASKAKDNSEINTLGYEPDAIVGLLFYGKDWGSSKPDFQKFIDHLAAAKGKGAKPTKNRTFKVYTFSKSEKGTLYKEIDILTAHPENVQE